MNIKSFLNNLIFNPITLSILSVCILTLIVEYKFNEPFKATFYTYQCIQNEQQSQCGIEGLAKLSLLQNKYIIKHDSKTTELHREDILMVIYDKS